MTLFVEIAAGHEPVIYRSKRRLSLVPKKYLLKCYKFACKAHALQRLKKYPDRYEFGGFVERALRETPTIMQLHYVERRPMRRRVKGWIESNQPAAPLAEVEPDDIEEEGDYLYE